MSRRLCNLKELCCVKRQKVLEIVVEAVSLAVQLFDDAVVASPGAVEIAHPRINELSG